MYLIRKLEPGLDLAHFHCGSAPLDEYIRRYAGQDVRRNLARVFVATPQTDPARLAGFFSLGAGSVNVAELPNSLRRKLPLYPVPVPLLGRLAIDAEFQGKGLGSILLVDACRKIAQASTILAVAGLVAEAKTESAAAFYRHFGFIDLPGCRGRLLLPAKAFPNPD
jgi:ribosomal protein S18 acetylase RimI-like enzyme